MCQKFPEVAINNPPRRRSLFNGIMNDPLGRDNFLFHQQVTVHFHIQGARGKSKKYENNENCSRT